VPKRPAVVSHGGIGYSVTNLLTFENCGGKPKDGKMIADDGTVLEVNGESHLHDVFYNYHFERGCHFFLFLRGGSCLVFGVSWL
jgi:hypothetical protein